MHDKSPRAILIAEMSYFVTVVMGVLAGYVFWKRHVASKVPADSEFGLASAYPMLLIIVFGMVVIFLFTLRRILVKADVLKKEDSLRFLYSRSWFINK